MSWRVRHGNACLALSRIVLEAARHVHVEPGPKLVSDNVQEPSQFMLLKSDTPC